MITLRLLDRHLVPQGCKVFHGGFKGDAGRLELALENGIPIRIGEFVEQQFVVKGITGTPVRNSLPGHIQVGRKGYIGRKTVLLGQSGQHDTGKTIFSHL